MKKFEVGDLVYLREDSEFAERNDSNPTGVIGEVVSCTGIYFELPLNVEWANGTNNNYGHKDLISEEDWLKKHGVYKTWGEMTDLEKGEILLAQHDGKHVQFYDTDGDAWLTEVTFTKYPDTKYRVKPEPVVKTLDVFVSKREGIKGWVKEVDGVIDWSTLNLKTLKERE